MLVQLIKQVCSISRWDISFFLNKKFRPLKNKVNSCNKTAHKKDTCTGGTDDALECWAIVVTPQSELLVDVSCRQLKVKLALPSLRTGWFCDAGHDWVGCHWDFAAGHQATIFCDLKVSCHVHDTGMERDWACM